MDLYEEAPQGGRSTAKGEGTDEAMAEKFRQEYLEAMEARSNLKKPGAVPAGKKDEQKGPKPGGSRSARAIQEKNAKR